jgi:ABC-type glycerol-3-phosphate transport system substrate-binding protein
MQKRHLFSPRLARLIALVVLVMFTFGSLPGAVAQSTPATDFTFTGWSLNEGLTRDVIMAATNTYAAANGITITDVAFPYNEYLNQVILQARGGQLSGAVQLDVAWMAPMSALGVLADLGPYVPEGVYTDAALGSCQVNGVQYGLPWTTASIGMVANAELLEAAGVTEIPTTIAEFEAALEALRAYSPDVVPYAAMTDLAQLKDIIPWIWTFGGTIIDADGNVVLNDAGSVAALEWYASLLSRGLIAADVDRFDARQLFAQGLVGFYDDAIVARSLAAGNKPADLTLTVIPVPRPVLNEGDAPQALLWGHCLAVVADDRLETAADFAVYLTSDEAVTTTYFQRLSLPPTVIAVLEGDVVQSDTYVSTWTSEITATARANPFWPYAAASRMEGILSQAAQDVMFGTMSAPDALAIAAEEIAELVR